MQVTVIGAGLAGCEAAWQLAQRGIAVTLHEMKPEKTTPAHHTADFAELCCSNSLRSDQIENAVGLLKEELRRLRGSRITMVLQNPMTCFDPLYRIGNQMSETFATHTTWNAQEIRSHCLKILNQMQILNGEEVLQKYPHQLSGGMLQRIMIGIAMALQPELLIADEPTTAIDAVTQYEILEEFVRIKKNKNTAMLFITHDLGAISKVADRILVMNSGHIVDSGNFEHIRNHAQDPYTRLLIEKRSAVMCHYRDILHGKEISHA